jgi:two-component system, NarL family, sensor histidine kinase UhpB
MRGRTIFILFLSFLVAPAYSQDKRVVDSLKGELVKFKSVAGAGGQSNTLKDSAAVLLMIQLSKAHWGADPATAQKYAQDALDLSQKIGYKAGVALGYHCLGTAQEDFGNYFEALEYYEKGLEIRKERKDRRGIAASYNNMGIIYYHQGDFPRALNNFIEALKMQEESGNVRGMANSNLNIGAIYVEQQNYERARAHFRTAVDLFGKADEKAGAALSYNNLGAVYQNMNRFDTAITLFNSALKIHEASDDKKGSAICLNNIGETYKKMQNYPEAVRYFKQSLALKQAIGDRKGIATTNSSLGMAHASLGQLNEALECETLALDIAKQLGAKDLIKTIYGNLAQVHAKRRNYAEAYRYEALHKQEHDSLFNKEKEKKITELRMQYEFDKKEAMTRAEQEKKDRISEAAILSQKRESRFYIAIGIFLLFAVVALWSRLNLARKTRKILEEKNAQIRAEREIAEQQRLRAELMDMRHKIAKDLHDDIGSSLSSISIYSEVAKNITAGSNPEANKILSSVGEIAQDALENMSDIVWTINPVNDKLDDIMQRLQVISNRLKEVKDINVHFQVSGGVRETSLTMRQRKNVYLIFKEAINNIAKYSGASNCFVVMEKKDETIFVTIKDDGKGFESSNGGMGGNGLVNMKQRALELDGTFAIASAKGQGTELNFTFKSA